MMRLFTLPLEGAHDNGEMSVTLTGEQFSESSGAPDITGSSRYVCNTGLYSTLTTTASVAADEAARGHRRRKALKLGRANALSRPSSPLPSFPSPFSSSFPFPPLPRPLPSPSLPFPSPRPLLPYPFHPLYPPLPFLAGVRGYNPRKNFENYIRT
jgi:hypothetical protein